MRRALLRLARDRRGNFATMTALVSPVLIVVAALGVDAGSFFVERRSAQNLTDLAGDDKNVVGRLVQKQRVEMERNVKRAREREELNDESFDEVLRSQFGMSLFKRWALSHFVEELVRFWAEVDCFKRGELAVPSEGTAIWTTSSSSIFGSTSPRSAVPPDGPDRSFHPAGGCDLAHS